MIPCVRMIPHCRQLLHTFDVTSTVRICCYRFIIFCVVSSWRKLACTVPIFDNSVNSVLAILSLYLPLLLFLKQVCSCLTIGFSFRFRWRWLLEKIFLMILVLLLQALMETIKGSICKTEKVCTFIVWSPTVTFLPSCSWNMTTSIFEDHFVHSFAKRISSTWYFDIARCLSVWLITTILYYDFSIASVLLYTWVNKLLSHIS